MLTAQQRTSAPSSACKILNRPRNGLCRVHSPMSDTFYTTKPQVVAIVSSSSNQTDAQTAPPQAIFQRLMATPLSQQHRKDHTSIAVMCVLGASYILSLVDPSSALAASSSNSDIHDAVAQPIADISENTEFWANVLRYVSYFFSVLLGTVFTILRPLANLMKNPLTAALVIAGAAGLYFFVSTTVQAMLGLNDIIEYEPSSIVTSNVQ